MPLNFFEKKSQKILSDFDLIIRYTNAMYTTPVEIQPTQEELRDLLSLGQLKSKSLIVELINKFYSHRNNYKIIIVGSWFGSLGYLIYKYNSSKIPIILLDKDLRCINFCKVAFGDIKEFSHIHSDMFEYQYPSNSIIINTACEQIQNLKDWINLCPKSCRLILQSNNLFHCKDHINCSNDLNDFISKTNLEESQIKYSNELSIGDFKRFTIVADL
jgi:hypothetical protein